MDTRGKFYIGKDVKSKENLLYDPDDLTTHAVVVGMTGSGKTGLCIDILEEAALQNVPALMIDPKGDITNTLLHFPQLLPEDFKPWVNPDEARKYGKTLDQAAADAAALWKKGLAGHDIGPDRIQALADSADFAIYTPGSDAGIPVNILASFKAPQISWDENKEILQERISGTVTALLNLVGVTDIDPVRSREHILLSNIFMKSWRDGADLDLGELILQTQNPPIQKLGVIDLDTFFPEKDRFELSVLLNNILAAPTFQSWITGVPLDIQSLLYSPNGKPRHSVFYIAHLSDAERMFFVTLLYSAVETWMRSQAGSTSLRALICFDEIFGFLPPVANPPSKLSMLRMLKQARAFGVGQILATQNPVDVDYKALSNAGTWFIGRLQTDQDKQRLLDGLEGAADEGLDRKIYDKMISNLQKREFLLHNVHEKKPQVFFTRWAMNYLAGPLTRTHIPALNKLVGAETPAGSKKSAEGVPVPVSAPEKKGRVKSSGSTTRPNVPSEVDEYFLPINLTLGQAAENTQIDQSVSPELLYKPVLLSQASIRFLQRKYDLDYDKIVTAVVSTPDERGSVRWEEYLTDKIDPAALDARPNPNAAFLRLDAPLSQGKVLKGISSDFADWIYHRISVTVLGNQELEAFISPPKGKEDLLKILDEVAEEREEEEIDKIKAKYKTKIASVQKKLANEKRELSEDEDEFKQRKLEELGTGIENVIGLFTGSRRRVTTSLTKRRMTSKAKADVEESEDKIIAFEKELADLSLEIEKEIKKIDDKWELNNIEIEEIKVPPFKKDILMDLFGVAWMPYYVVDSGNRKVELKAYKAV
jgi:hypothetical protein